MNNDKIIEGNKLIAFSDFSSEGIHEWVHSMDSTPSDNFCSKVLNYHEKWEMLMPVVEKIESYGYPVFIFPKSMVAINKNGTISSEHVARVDNYKLPKIEAVWLAVVEFVKWYNQQNK